MSTVRVFAFFSLKRNYAGGGVFEPKGLFSDAGWFLGTAVSFILTSCNWSKRGDAARVVYCALCRLVGSIFLTGWWVVWWESV